MRPRLLEIEGFSSFRQKRSIDFSDMQVFSITGPNGAGKSSLLDAIIFSLYGETPRFTKEKRELVCKGCDELNVLFEFSIGQAIYRVSRQFRLKGQPYVTVEQRKENEWITLGEGEANVEDQIAKIIRMPARAFMQSVIIPQGRFDIFLKPAQPKDRTRTLTEMFDLGIYEKMREKAAEISRSARDELQSITMRLSDELADATKESLGLLKKKRKDLKGIEKELKKRIQELKTSLERVREVVDCKEKRQEQERKIQKIQDDLNKELEGCDLIKEKLERWRQKDEGRLNELQTEADRLSEVIEILKSLNREFENLIALEKRQRLAKEQLEQLTQSSKQTLDNLAQLEIQQKNLAIEIAKLSFNEDVWGKLNRSRQDIAHLALLHQQKDRISKEIEDESKNQPQIQQHLEEEAAQSSICEAALSKLEDELRELDRALHVQELRTGLSAGEKCPVCESEVGELHEISRDGLERLEDKRSLLLSTINNRKDEVRTSRDTFASLKEQLQGSKGNVEKLRGNEEEFESQIQDLEISLRQIAEIPPGHDISVFLSAFLKEQDRQMEQYSSLNKTLTGLLRAIETAKESGRDCSDKISRKEEELNGLDIQIVELKNEITGIETNPLVVPYLEVTRSPDEAIKGAQKRQSKLRFDVQAIRDEGVELQKELSEANGKISTHKENLTSELDLLKELGNQWAAFSDEERGWNRPFLRDLESKDEKARADQQSTSHELGEVESDINSMQHRIEIASQLTSRKAELEKTRDSYGIIAADLQAHKLQRYIVGKLLRTLVANANVYLKDLTESKYQLGLDSKEELIIRDLSNGGAERSVKGLSGGETFVISLSLALALSSAIGQGVHIECLFLDEGFGSLDKDRLELVREALLQLPLYDKVVGVVTHIEDFAKAFPGQFVVANTAEGTEVTRIA